MRSAILALAIVALVASGSANAQFDPPMCGDADGDGARTAPAAGVGIH